MPRLLILCEYPTVLGGERSMLSTLPAIATAGFDVCVAGPAVGLLAETLRGLGVAHAAFESRDAADVRRPLENLREEMDQLFGQLRPNLVHANSLSMARIAGPVAAAAPIPSIGHLRDIVRLSPPAVADLNAHRRLIAVSAATRDYHVAQGVTAENCVVIHNGVDLTLFSPQTANGYLHDELGVPPGSRLIATIGQLGLRKGTDIALAAAAGVLAEFPDVHWLIVGERTSQKEEAHEFEVQLRAAASAPPLSGRIHFLGSRADVPKLLNECTLLVHAARQEPLGRVLLEAAASGLAVVATDVGGTREIFPTPAEGAILVPPDDADNLRRAISSVLSNDSHRISLAQAARRRAETAFDVRAAAARLIAQYRAEL